MKLRDMKLPVEPTLPERGKRHGGRRHKRK
jgi:hypothetical protein